MPDKKDLYANPVSAHHKICQPTTVGSANKPWTSICHGHRLPLITTSVMAAYNGLYIILMEH